MKLYHGSPVAGIETLKPSLSNHGEPYVYLTHIETLAVIYAYNPLTPPDGYFPYYVNREDGSLHYDEYFPGAFDEIFTGKSGYVYTCEIDRELERLDKMTWVHLSPEPVKVSKCRFIPDLRAELLDAERKGLLTIHRYETLSERKREGIKNMILREFEAEGGLEKPDSESVRFYRKYFSYIDELFG